MFDYLFRTDAHRDLGSRTFPLVKEVLSILRCNTLFMTNPPILNIFISCINCTFSRQNKMGVDISFYLPS